MTAQSVLATLLAEQADTSLAPLKDPNPVLLAILALLADRPDSVEVLRVASTALSGHRAVVPLDSGEVTYADNDIIDHLNRPVWLTVNAWGADELATLVAYGMVQEPTWAWVPGAAIFLGDDGYLTQTAPTSADARFLRQLGSAVTATSMFYDPHPPIALASLGGYGGAYGGGYYGLPVGGYAGAYAYGY